MCKLFAFLLATLILGPASHHGATAQVTDVELHNIRWDWHSHNDATNELVPFFGYKETTTIHFKVDLNKYRGSQLKFVLQENTFCWIEDQLIFRAQDSKPRYITVDSLKKIYDKNQLSFTLYNEALDARLIKTTIISQNKIISTEQQGGPELRKELSRSDTFIVISVLILLMIAVFRTAHFRLFREYFSLSRALQQRQSFDLITAYSPLAWPNIGFIIFYAVLIGCSVVNIGLFQFNAEIKLPLGLTQSNSLVVGTTAGVLCLASMLLKLALVSASTTLFMIQKVRLIHFFTYFRHSLIIAMIIFIFSLFNGIFEGSMVSSGWMLIQVLVILVWSARVVHIFFVLNKIYTFRKLHLFSYLCSTELIPLLLFFKIFLK